MQRFSVSLIGTYETCPYKCLRQYNVVGEEKIEDDLNFYGEFGALIHELFDMYYKSDKHISFEEMLEIFHKKVTEMECEFPDGKKDKYLSGAYDQIEYFYDKYAIMKPIRTEEEIDFYIEGIDLPFKGFIDRVDGSIEEQDIVLSDYKTGRSSKFTKKELSDNVQATVYALYYKQKYGFYPSRFVFIFTNERKTKEIEINEAFVQRGLARLRRSIEAINNNIFIAEPKGGKYFCKEFCKYYVECPKYIKSNDGWDL